MVVIELSALGLVQVIRANEFLQFADDFFARGFGLLVKDDLTRAWWLNQVSGNLVTLLWLDAQCIKLLA